MKPIFLAATMLCLAATTAVADTCKSTAQDKKLAGAALKSYVTKCEKDARAACDAKATDRKLSGAAKTSFIKKCLNDAVERCRRQLTKAGSRSFFPNSAESQEVT
jgi:hypothetical protein